MKAVVKVYGKEWALVLHWLKENIGQMLHSRPIIFWHGNGWHMTLGRDIEPHGAIGDSVITVEFDKLIDATWFGLVWI
jgi:hypothetical protein